MRSGLRKLAPLALLLVAAAAWADYPLCSNLGSGTTPNNFLQCGTNNRPKWSAGGGGGGTCATSLPLLCLGGRTGTTNNPTISIDATGTIRGSGTAGFGLDVGSDTGTPGLHVLRNGIGIDRLTLGPGSDPTAVVIPGGALQFLMTSEGDPIGPAAGMIALGGSGNAPLWFTGKGGGTFASPTATQNGDPMFQLNAIGWDSTNSVILFPPAGTLNVTMDGSPSSGFVPGRMDLSVTDSAGGVGGAIALQGAQATVSVPNAPGAGTSPVNTLTIQSAQITLSLLDSSNNLSSQVQLIPTKFNVGTRDHLGVFDNNRIFIDDHGRIGFNEGGPVGADGDFTFNGHMTVGPNAAFLSTETVLELQSGTDVLPLAFLWPIGSATGEAAFVSPIQGMVRVNQTLPGNVSFRGYDGTQWRSFAMLDTGAIGTPIITDRVITTNNTTDIPDTALAGTSTVGTYRVSVYLVDKPADITAGAVTAHIKFTDNATAQDSTVGPIVLTTLGTKAQADIVVQVASGNITYGTTHTGIFGTSKYDLTVISERI